MILLIMVPLRVKMNKKIYDDPNHVSKFYAGVVILHMVLCLGWLVFALCELKGSSPSCWTPFTF